MRSRLLRLRLFASPPILASGSAMSLPRRKKTRACFRTLVAFLLLGRLLPLASHAADTPWERLLEWLPENTETLLVNPDATLLTPPKGREPAVAEVIPYLPSTDSKLS